MDTFKQEAAKIPGVISVANSNAIPGRNFSLNAFLLEGDSNMGTSYTFEQAFVSPGYEKTLGLELVEGRFLSSDIPTDSNAVVISEATVKALGRRELIFDKMKIIKNPFGKNCNLF